MGGGGALHYTIDHRWSIVIHIAVAKLHIAVAKLAAYPNNCAPNATNKNRKNIIRDFYMLCFQVSLKFTGMYSD